jgi:hypothetical protein
METQTVSTEEVPYFTVQELKEIQLGTLLPAAVKMGVQEAMAATRDCVVGMVFVAQKSSPETVIEMRTKLQSMKLRQTRILERRAAETPKPRERSAVGGAVEKVHAICNKMKGQPRKDVIAECVKMGINENTAKTQYYKWMQTQ